MGLAHSSLIESIESFQALGSGEDMVSIRLVRKDACREAIVSAAELLIRKSGGGSFSVRQLAAAAGTSSVTCYSYFGSKGAVCAAVLAAQLVRLETQLARLNGGTLRDRAYSLTDHAVRETIEDEAIYRAAVAVLVGEDRNFEALSFIAVAKRLWLNVLNQYPKDAEGPDITILAEQLATSFSGHVITWLAGEISAETLGLKVRSAVALILAAGSGENERKLFLHDARQFSDELAVIEANAAATLASAAVGAS
jgi:AcrR family transcriptional regulator